MALRSALAFFLSAIMSLGAASQARIGMSLDASGGYDFISRTISAENQATLGWYGRAGSEPYVEMGNWLGYEEAWSDEFFLGAGFSPFDWLDLSLHPVIVLAPELDVYLRPAVSLSWEFDELGLTLSDDNELAVYLLGGGLEYNNVLDCEISFDIGSRAYLILGISNELAWADGLSDTAKARVGAETEHLSLALRFDLGLRPSLSPGMGVEVSVFSM